MPEHYFPQQNRNTHYHFTTPLRRSRDRILVLALDPFIRNIKAQFFYAD
jgi:hypothetical protein